MVRKQRGKRSRSHSARAFPAQRGQPKSASKRRRKKTSGKPLENVSRPNKHRKVPQEQKDFMIWKVKMGFPIKDVFFGYGEKLYWQWQSAEEKERKTTGPPRLLPEEVVEDTIKKLTAGVYNSVRHAADSLADEWRVCRRTLHREITTRREARGGKKITRKKPAKRRTDANQPRVYDMHLGFIPVYDKIAKELMSHGDEFPIPFGIGEHRTAMYAPAGQTPIADTPYRCNTAHAICAISCAPPKILKVAVQEKPYAGDDCYKFYTETTPSPPECPNLGGPPLVDLIAKTSAKFFFHDLLGRGGRAHQPSKGHFHPDIPRSFCAKGIREVKLPPQGHYFNPQEYLNRDLQQAVREWNTDPGNKPSGPQNFRDVELALNSAVEKFNTERNSRGTTAERCIKKGYNARGSSKNYTHMMESMGDNVFKRAYNEVKKKRRTTTRGTPYSVPFDPDGKGTKTVYCLNLDIEDFVQVTALEKTTAASTAPLQNWPGGGPASVYTMRVPRSSRESAREV